MNREIKILMKLKNIFGPNFQVEPFDREKLNGVKKSGICIRKKDEEIGVVFYYDNFPDDPDEAVDYILVAYVETHDEARKAFHSLIDYNRIKKHIRLKLFNKNWNKDYLEDFVYINTVDDLTIGAWLEIPYTDDLYTQIRINKKICEEWGVSDTQVIEDGFKNFAEDKTKMYYSSFFPGLYVFTNEEKHDGAIRILDREAVKQAAQELDDDLYFLPSSIHEWMVIPAKEVYSIWVLQEIVKSANQEVVAPEERLGENVYFYNREEDTLGMVEDDNVR